MARKVTSLTFDLFGRDRTASKAMKGVGDQAGKTAQTLQRAGAAMAAGIAVAGAAAVAFGVQSVRAFAEAQEAQERLNFAYSKFPALADVTRESFNRLNAALQAKTGFDDDVIASSQGVLAQFGLTGEQIQRLTPLLLDYARANGKDLTSSAEDLGRALLGQGRALKTLGLDFDDAGSVAANYDQLIAGLTTNVAGYAETFGTTAAGKFEILTAKWGDFQEQVGEALLPGLERLMEFAESDVLPALTEFAEWFGSDGVEMIAGFMDEVERLSEDGTLVPGVVAGIGAVTAAQIGLNAAMAANPIGLVVLAVAALVAQFAFVITHLEDFKLKAGNVDWAQPFLIMMTGWVGIIAFFAQNWDTVWRFVQSVFITHVNSIIAGINLMLQPLQAVLDVVNQLTGSKLSVRIAPLNLPRLVDPVRSSQHSVNTSQMSGFRAMAEGGIVRATPGGIPAVVGEGLYDEAVVPLSPRVLSQFGGGATYNVNISGVVAGSRGELARVVVRAIQDAQKLGDIPRGALA